MIVTEATVFLRSAMRDARVATDARGLMPIEEARRVVAGLTTFEKAPADDTPVLGADLAWAAILSLADAREFLDAARRIHWNFHVRGHGNLAALERYGEAILPWIAHAIDARGNLRNVPWCLYPCLLAIGTPEALDVAFLVRSTSADLDDDDAEPGGEEPTTADGPLDLGAAPAWLAHRAAERLALVARRAEEDPRCRALLARAVETLGPASIAALRPAYGDDAAVEAALGRLRIAVPRTPPEIEAQLAGLPCADVPEGPPWSVVELDQEQFFPYWEVLSGYETPYAIRVHAFASRHGDALFVQRICRDERASDPCTRHIGVYGPGASGVDRRACMTQLVSKSDVSGVHLPDGAGYVDGVSEVARIWGDGDEQGVPTPGAFRARYVRNPMPHEGVLVMITGSSEDLLLPPREPSSWTAIAASAADETTMPPEAMLRGIDPAEQLLFRLVLDHREELFLGEAALRTLAKLPDDAELLFTIEDPELPEVFADLPPSKVAPWPLLREALRRRVRLDPARIDRVDVLRRRMRWTEGRGGAEDAWGPETSPTLEERLRGVGATAYADELLARGWPHGVRLLHVHPHNDAGAAVFDWLIAQPALPYRSSWPREVATRFLRHLGGAPDARERGGWIFEREARRILSDVIGRSEGRVEPLVAEHLTLLLEAFVGGPTLLTLVREVIESMPVAARSAPHPDGAHVLAALGWIVRRVRSPAGREAIEALDAAVRALDPATDLGRALDLALHGDDGVRRSARRPEELALARDPALVRERLGTSSVPLDLQLACLLGDEAIESWERASPSAAEAAWFADELVLLASPRAHALAERLRGS